MSSVAWIRTLPFRLAAAAAAAGLAAALGGCTAAPEPREPAASTAHLAEALEQFSNRMLDGGAPAVLMQAKVRGQEWSRASGVRSLEGREPAEITDSLHVASVTKSFVAVSVLKLAAEGKLGLDDPVSRHLPDFDSIMHPPGPVTIRRLLQHQSGMPDYVVPLMQQGSLREVLTTSWKHGDLLALAASQRWERKLGQGFEYSNTNYVALGMIVERLRGQPIGDVLREDVIEPLGLRGTRLTDLGSPPPSLVHGYVTIFGERLDVSYPALHAGAAAGGLLSSVGDLNTFYAALLQGRLVPPAMVAEMQSPLYARYGLGIQRWNDTCTNNFYYGHGGGTVGYGTVSMSSADGTRQATVSLAYPPGSFTITGNGIVEDLTNVVEDALNASC
ncbi:serine hydrolase domain-containing protein [Arthrobacter oryzae]|uniref:serine hydrolase domain-containing protein n=1 Tax=Arthrobacter oryzae TaxID=409290 RepID=UPI00286CA430|nr:serine hydrolase domain-containing protein [Arthrobacter oryzae]